MVDDLNSIGSIAVHILENFNNTPAGVSGNMIEIIDQSRQHVANFVGVDIGSNSIAKEYQPAIVYFSKADTIDFVNAQAGGESIRLAELSIDDKGEEMSSKQWRMLGESALNNLGRVSRFARSLS